MGLGNDHLGCGPYQVYSNDDPRLNSTSLWQGHNCFLVHLFEKNI